VVYQTAPFSMTLNNEQPLTQFSRSRYSLMLNISQTVRDTAIVTSRRPSATFNAGLLVEFGQIYGSGLCIALYIIRHSLNRIRCDTGSQCNRQRIKPETCEYFHTPQSILAAPFITRFIQSRAYRGTAERRLLQ